jgi:hypothetical protein
MHIPFEIPKSHARLNSKKFAIITRVISETNFNGNLMSTARAVRKADPSGTSTVKNFRLLSWRFGDIEVLIQYQWPISELR